MDYFFSPSKNTFHPADMREIYEAAGSWPSDAKPIGADVFEEFSLKAAPSGKMRGVKKGRPVWVDDPAAVVSKDALRANTLALFRAGMNACAVSLGHDSMQSAVTFAEEEAVPRLQAEGRALRAWRSVVLEAARGIADKVAAGDVQMPDSVASAMAMVPRFGS